MTDFRIIQESNEVWKILRPNGCFLPTKGNGKIAATFGTRSEAEELVARMVHKSLIGRMTNVISATMRDQFKARILELCEDKSMTEMQIIQLDDKWRLVNIDGTLVDDIAGGHRAIFTEKKYAEIALEIFKNCFAPPDLTADQLKALSKSERKRLLSIKVAEAEAMKTHMISFAASRGIQMEFKNIYFHKTHFSDLFKQQTSIYRLSPEIE